MLKYIETGRAGVGKLFPTIYTNSTGDKAFFEAMMSTRCAALIMRRRAQRAPADQHRGSSPVYAPVYCICRVCAKLVTSVNISRAKGVAEQIDTVRELCKLSCVRPTKLHD